MTVNQVFSVFLLQTYTFYPPQGFLLTSLLSEQILNFSSFIYYSLNPHDPPLQKKLLCTRFHLNYLLTQNVDKTAPSRRHS